MKIVICLPVDHTKHYLDSEICFITVYEEYGSITPYPVQVVSCKSSTPLFAADEPLLVYNKRLFDRFFTAKTYDLSTEYWLHTGKDLNIQEVNSTLSLFARFYKDYEKPLAYLSLPKLLEISNIIYREFKETIPEPKVDETSEFYRTTIYPSIVGIEKNQLQVDLPKFNTCFKKQYIEDKVTCNYFLHTSTGRPSNTFDNVNFSALNKNDGSRESFISRFENGKLVEFDFDAYHVRLIADMIKYKFPDDISIHEYSGKFYFRTESLSEAQYKESKALTFKFLYSTVSEEYRNIEFFKQVETLKDNIWESVRTTGYIESPVSKKKIYLKNYEDMSRAKLFNYLLQSVETEVSMLFIKEVIALLQEKKSKLILYTYDSFLIDFCLEDGKKLLQELTELIKHAKVKVGDNYQNLKSLG